jgi:heat shock protein HslJ
MQNPDKYIPAYMLVKTGGWTYNTDWQRNKNFPKEAEGTWQLVLTPEVETSWINDTSRPETYASYWTPEAVAARREVAMLAAARTADSLRVLDSIAMVANAPAKSGKNKSGKYSKSRRGSMSANTSATAGVSTSGDATASTSSDAAASTSSDAAASTSGDAAASTSGDAAASTSGDVTASTAVTGSGTTGEVGTGGLASTATPTGATSSGMAATTSATDASAVATTTALTAVNGNNFMMPTISLHIGNGSFTAYTGCNDAIGTLMMEGNKLRFTQAAPATNIQCIGGFDQASFLDRLTRADNFDVVNNQIRFKQGEQVLMVFAKPAHL